MGGQRLSFSSLLLVAVLLGATTPAPAEKATMQRFAVLPSAPPVVTSTTWSPFVERLSRDTGLPLRLKVYENMSDFERDIVSRDAPEFIFSSPLQAVVAHQEQGYQPLVRGGTPVWAELFVRGDSPARTVGDLAGKTIAFAGNKNLCSIYVRHFLTRESRTLPFQQEHFGSGANTIRAVLLGKADAGAAFSPDLEKEPAEVRDQIRSLLVTPRIAPHPISAHARVPHDAREALKNAVLALAATPEGAELLARIRLAAPVATSYERDYQSLEGVDVKKLSSWGE